MTVKTLKKMLKKVPDDMRVFVQVESAIGGFMFAEACEGESGVVDFGPPDEESGETGPEIAFILMPHGATSHDDNEEDTSLPAELN